MDHQPADRSVGSPQEGKRLRPRGHRQGGPDYATMHKDSNTFIRMGCRNIHQTPAHAAKERIARLGSGNRRPILRFCHTGINRIALRRLDPVKAAVPVPQMHLVQVRVFDRNHAQMTRQRRRRLVSSHQLRHVKLCKTVILQSVAHRQRLPLALRVQGRVAMPILHGEINAGPRRRAFPMADQQQISRPVGWRIDGLAVFLTHDPFYQGAFQ
mmetsp:Transcript_27806/g.51855  ORF Transcript_27806/g.51855 Transcript_27806/m.51855 type:complete len:212 (-) Transcript_27806:3604-4239(-)